MYRNLFVIYLSITAIAKEPCLKVVSDQPISKKQMSTIGELDHLSCINNYKSDIHEDWDSIDALCKCQDKYDKPVVSPKFVEEKDKLEAAGRGILAEIHGFASLMAELDQIYPNSISMNSCNVEGILSTECARGSKESERT